MLAIASVRLCGAASNAQALGLGQALRGKDKSTHIILNYLLAGVPISSFVLLLSTTARHTIKRRDQASAAHAPVCSPPDHQYIYPDIYSSCHVPLRVEWDAQLS